MTGRKVTMSFEESRKAMVEGMMKVASKELIEKKIPFTNEDVPEFLDKIDKFEEESRKVRLVVK